MRGGSGERVSNCARGQVGDLILHPLLPGLSPPCPLITGNPISRPPILEIRPGPTALYIKRLNSPLFPWIRAHVRKKPRTLLLPANGVSLFVLFCAASIFLGATTPLL